MEDEPSFSEACFVCTCDSNGTDLLTVKYEHNLMSIWEDFEELSIDTSPIHQLQLQLSLIRDYIKKALQPCCSALLG